MVWYRQQKNSSQDLSQCIRNAHVGHTSLSHEHCHWLRWILLQWGVLRPIRGLMYDSIYFGAVSLLSDSFELLVLSSMLSDKHSKVSSKII